VDVTLVRGGAACRSTVLATGRGWTRPPAGAPLKRVRPPLAAVRASLGHVAGSSQRASETCTAEVTLDSTGRSPEIAWTVRHDTDVSWTTSRPLRRIPRPSVLASAGEGQALRSSWTASAGTVRANVRTRASWGVAGIAHTRGRDWELRSPSPGEGYVRLELVVPRARKPARIVTLRERAAQSAERRCLTKTPGDQPCSENCCSGMRLWRPPRGQERVADGCSRTGIHATPEVEAEAEQAEGVLELASSSERRARSCRARGVVRDLSRRQIEPLPPAAPPPGHEPGDCPVKMPTDFFPNGVVLEVASSRPMAPLTT